MTTFVGYPAQYADDACQNSSGGAITLGGASEFAMALSSSYPYAGSRFENITVAAGVTVSSATISLYGESKSLSLSSANVMGVKQANPGVFTTTTSRLSTLRSSYPTTNTYSWTATLSTSGYVASGDISAIITELLGQGSWASGNAMAFTYAYGASNAIWYAYANGSLYEELTITYTSGGGYTVTFDNNGGTGSLTAETDSSPTALSLFSTGTMAYAGYTFDHWNTAADNSGTSYADGASYPFTANVTLYAIWAAIPLTRIISLVLVRTTNDKKSINKLISAVCIKIIRLTKQKISVFKTVQIKTALRSKLVNKNNKVTNIQSAKINKLVSKFNKVTQIQLTKLSKTKNWIVKAVQIQSAKVNKIKNMILRIVQTNVATTKKLVIKNIRSVQMQTVSLVRIIIVPIITRAISIVQINTAKLNKQKNSTFRIVQIQSVRISKIKSTTLRILQVNTVKVSKLVSKIKKLVQTNLVRFSTTYIPRFLGVAWVNAVRQVKTKTSTLRAAQINTIRLGKTLTKSIRVTFVEKAGEIGETFYRIIAPVLIYSAKQSKSVAKFIKSTKINTARLNKQTNKNSRVTEIQSTRLNKAKQTTFKATQVQNTRINKQKQWNAKADKVQSVRITKFKTSIIRFVQVLTDLLSKQKNTTIKSTTVWTTRFPKKVAKNPKAAQAVAATITRAAARKRGITSGITYTIGTSRRVTLYRKIKVVLTNTINTNKGINKNTKVSNTNIWSFVKPPKLWKFLIQFVTKITSFKSQVIGKPGHAIPDPNAWDPNMIDPSTPQADGLIYGNPDDDR